MTDIETLVECRMAAMEERALAKQIERLSGIGAPRGVGSQAMELAGDRHTNNAQAAQLQKLDGLIDKLERQREENIGIIERAEAVIVRLKDRRARVIIRYYYVEGQSDYEIARDMDMSPQWVQKQRNRILENFRRG